MIGDSTGQVVGKIGVIRVESQERQDRSQDVFNVIGLPFSRRRASAPFIAKPSVDRSASDSARIRSMVAAGALKPPE